jgi:hypothetical protein
MSKSKHANGVDAIMAGFPSQPDKIMGEPNYKTIRELQDTLEENATSIECGLGGGSNGYLGVLLSAAEYATIPGTVPFIAPVNPGHTAPPVAGAAAAIANQARVFDEAYRKYQEYSDVVKALRKQLVASVDEAYIIALKHDRSMYNAVPLEQMLAHLIDEYGEISHEDYKLNEAKFNEPWDGAEPIELIVARWNKCIKLAAASGKPYSDEQILEKAFAIVYDCGLYYEELKDWKRKPAHQRTYLLFQSHVKAAQKEYRLQQRTSKRSGFGLATQELVAATEHFAYFMAQAESKEAAANALAREREATSTAKEQRLMLELAEIRALLMKQGTCLPVGTAAPNIPGQPSIAGAPARRQRKDSGGYCWSHGYYVTPTHTSATCATKRNGHVDTATRENNMGGSQYGKPRPAQA